MRILGLDYGEVRIGVAISDPLGITAQGLKTIEREKLFSYLKELLLEYEVKEIVVGLPKNLKGEIAASAKKVREFIQALKGQFSLPIKEFDERFTTKVSENILISAGVSRKKRKKVIDKLAAVKILEGYLENEKISSAHSS